MTNHKKMLDREAVRSVIQQWNANRLDLFALSEPDENLLFHGVMRFYFQDAGQKVATKCIRVASDATVADVIDTLIEKFRPDMRMLSVPNYALYEVHANGEERRLNPDEKPLLVQLNWHIDDREGRFLLKNIDQKTTPIETTDMNFKRKLSKREKKEQKKKEKLAKLNSDSTGSTDNETHVAGKLYTELPETSFTRSISNPEAVMRRRRQQKLEKKLQQFRSRDGGPDTGGTLKIYGESLCQDVPYKTLLLSIRDCAQAVVREMLAKYGLDKADPLHYCLVQVNCDGTEYILDDDECPLSILMNHPTSRGSIMFHVRRRPADSQPRRRKKKPLGASNGANSTSSDREGPVLVEVTHSGDGGRRIKLGSDPIEVGSANTNSLQLFGPSIQARHCLISLSEGVCTVTPLHADALTFVNGHHITQPTILHNGSVVMFGRVASYRFLDSPSDGRYNLALSQSQLDSACLYESRSPTSPASWNDEDGTISSNQKGEFETTSTHNHVGSGIISERALNLAEENKKVIPSRSTQEHLHTHTKETESNYDGNEPNVESETKSISSLKSSGSTNQDQRSQKTVSGLDNQGQEPILPAVLEFPETHQENFLCQILTELDVNVPHFKLAPVYTLYLCARYRASTHYRPELQPTERAHKLTIFLHHVANLIYSVIQEQYADPRILAFWMANSSEFLHFLKSDRHISAFSVQAQEILAESVQTAFRNLVNCFRVELSQTLNQFMSETIDHDSAAGLVLTVLGSAMALLRRCRVNAALTIQLFSQLFHYINVICFNTIVANSHMCTAEWGKVITDRLQLLELWAERQGLELAADCHLAKINQCAQFLQAPKTSVEEIQKLACSCFRLNSLQMSALLQQEKIPRTLIDTVIRMAESVADELTRADGREVRLEESPELHLALLLPDDGFSCDVVRGIPSGLVDFLNPLQSAGMCRLAAQPTSIGLWTVYMHQFNARSPSAMSNKLPQPEVQVIKLHKNSNGMGLSIVAAKGAGQERLGIYIKSVVPGGAADADGRLQAGDQLLRVDGQSLIGITQERAADYLVRTGPVVTLEVAKQGAIYHGLATLLQQPSPVIQRGSRRLSERDVSRMGVDSKNVGPLNANSHLANSKSVPALHHSSNNLLNIANSKSRSTHSLANNNEQGFYQNLSVYRAQNQSQPIFGERPQIDSSNSAVNMYSGNLSNSIQQQTSSNPASGTLHQKNVAPPTSINQNNILNRPASAYYQSSANTNYATNTSNITMPLSNPMLPFNDNHGISASSTNINANGNISSSSNAQLHHMQPQSSLTMGNRSKSTHNFNRDGQSQSSLRMNQIFAPSMPNIAAAHTASASPNVYNGGMSSSQSMQNVTMITHPVNPGENLQPHGFANGAHNHNQQYITKPSSSNHMGGGRTQPIIGDMSMRRNHRIDMMQDSSHQLNQMMLPPNNQQLLQQQEQHHSNAAALPPKPQGMMHNSNAQPGMPSKQQLPPNVSKSQSSRVPQGYQPQQSAEETPPLPPTTTHPLFKATPQTSQGMNYVASTADPPKGGYYPVNASAAHQTNFMGTNPWEREEREKEHEMRREHIRHWRDQQIVELSTLPQRSPQQEEQLKTLVLERDFERRAQEVEEQEDESEPSFEKENYQEVVRLTNQASTIQTPITNFRQTDIRIEQEESMDPSINTIPLSDSQALYMQNYQIQQTQAPMTVQPKGILKNNRYDSSSSTVTPSSPSKSHKSASFADERHLQTEHNMSSLVKDVSHMNINFELNTNSMERLSSAEHSSQMSTNSINSGVVPPPPPPERNSSYIIMSQQQQKIRNSTTNLLKTTAPPPAEMHNQNNMSMYSNGSSNSKKSGFALATTNNNNPSLKNIQTQGINEMHSPISSSTGISVPSNLLMLGRDNKRVSFHDEENNYVPSQMTTHTNEQSYNNDQSDLLHTICENPLDFSSESTEMLQTPTTPDADMWNSTVQSTPGVIGAQEVYRDPRQRRLAEQQQKQQQRTSEAVPEKLSFKEKMKMFALESGEDQTPKDKLKISRAQRDIDAVH